MRWTQPNERPGISDRQRQQLLALLRAELRARYLAALAAGADPAALAETLDASRRMLTTGTREDPPEDPAEPVTAIRTTVEWSTTVRQGEPGRRRAPHEPAAASAPATVPAMLAELLEGLTAELAAVRQLMAVSDERAAAQDRIIDRLHADNERLRGGERHLAVRPLLVDLQRLRDDLLRQAAASPTAEMAVASLLESFAYSVEQTLARCGVEVLRPEVGSPFDATRQRAAGVVPAARAELDGTVAEVLSDGYLDTAADRALTSATVRVYRCPPPDSDPSGG